MILECKVIQELDCFLQQGQFQGSLEIWKCLSCLWSIFKIFIFDAIENGQMNKEIEMFYNVVHPLCLKMIASILFCMNTFFPEYKLVWNHLIDIHDIEGLFEKLIIITPCQKVHIFLTPWSFWTTMFLTFDIIFILNFSFFENLRNNSDILSY